HVDALDPEPPQARLELALNAHWCEPVVLPLVHRVEGLRRKDDVLAHVESLRLQPVADPRLAATAAVRVGGVERRDPGLPGGVHDRERFFTALAFAEERRRGSDAAEVAAAEDDPRDPDAGTAEVGSLHERDATRRPGGTPPLLVPPGRLRLPRRARWIPGARRGRRRNREDAARGGG